MPKPTQRKRQLSSAREKRANFGHPQNPKPVEYVLGAKDISLPPQNLKRVSLPFTPTLVTPPNPKRRRFMKKSPGEKEKISSFKFDATISKLERKWFAVSKYCWHMRPSDQYIPPIIVKQIAKDANVTVGSVRSWVECAMKGNSLLPKKG